MAENSGPMQVDVELVRQLAELLDHTHLTEIEVEDGARKIRVASKAAAVTAAPMAYAAAPVAPAATAPAPAATADAAPVERGEHVRSPMVGTVYLAPEPGARPYAAVGDMVSEGQTIVIIEAMKVMNPIPATKSGRVVRVCVENGQPVEFDQSLIIVE